MELNITAEDKSKESQFQYYLQVADDTILLGTALIAGSLAFLGLCSIFKQ